MGGSHELKPTLLCQSEKQETRGWNLRNNISGSEFPTISTAHKFARDDI